MAGKTHHWLQSLQTHASPAFLALARLEAGRRLIGGGAFVLALCALALAAFFASGPGPVLVEGAPAGQQRPTACAGPDLTGAPGEKVTLQGRCSKNPYGKWHHMAHAWKQLSGPEVTLNDATRGNPSFTIPASAADGTTLKFQLKVTDQEGQSDTDTVLVTVDSTPEPTPPTACAGPDMAGEQGEEVRLEGTCSTNPHGQWWRMAHRWTQPEGQNIALSDATKGRPTLTIPAGAAPGTVYTFTLTVTDKDGESDSDDTTVTVENRAPAFNEGSSATRKVAENSDAGVNVGAAITASDPDGDALTYSLTGNDAGAFAIDAKGQLTTVASVTYDYETKRSYSVTVSANDPEGLSASIDVTISLTNVNEAPSFGESSVSRSVAENTAADVKIGAAITAADPDGDALTYSLTGDDADAFAIDGASQLTTVDGITYDYEAKSSYSVTVTATDPDGLSASIDVAIGLTNVNEVPAFGQDAAAFSVAENTAGGVNVGSPLTATDPDGDALTYALSGTDAGAFAIDGKGQLTTIDGITYDYEAKVSYSLTVTVSDGNGATASIAVTVSLIDVDETLPVAGADYDVDADGLIEVASLAQLRAIFFDLNGDGAPDPTDAAEFQAAYPNPLPDMGCRTACVGYELAANLDFDSNGNGEADAGDAYWNDGAGWEPIGGGTVGYSGEFHGNGYTISNLYVNRSGAAVGLFGRLGGSAYVHHVGLIDASVTNASPNSDQGNAAGESDTGALVGEISSADAVVAASYATGAVSGGAQTGGLVGDNKGRIVAVWTGVNVTGTDTVGGIVGDNAGAVVASYATSLAMGGDVERTKGVAGRTHGSGSVQDSYYNSDTNPPDASGDPGGKTWAQLLEPTGYTGIYANWNVDVDGDGAADDPWDFGGSGDYPLLKADRNGDGTFTWREFGSPAQPEFSVQGQSGDATVLKVKTHRGTYFKDALGREICCFVEPGARIFLLASTRGSTIPPGTQLTYAWEQLSGPAVTLTNADSSVAEYTVPIDEAKGTQRKFRVTVTAGDVTATATEVLITVRFQPLALAGLDGVAAPGATVVLHGSGLSSYVRPKMLSYDWWQESGPTVVLNKADPRHPSFTMPAGTPEGTVLRFRLAVTDPGGLSDHGWNGSQNYVAIAARAREVGSIMPTTSCFIYLGELTSAVQYVGAWNDHDCSAHHSSGLARYFNFTLPEEAESEGTEFSVRLSQGSLFISEGAPQRGWGSPPALTVTHEVRNAKRMENGKLVHYDSNSATKTLPAGEYTVEASGSGVFNIIIKPGAAPTTSLGTPPAANAGRDLSGAPGATVTLRGTGSINPHGPGHEMLHQWTQVSGPTVTLTHPDATSQKPASKFGDPRFVVPANAATGTNLVFKLTVIDEDVESDTDTMTVTVTDN